MELLTDNRVLLRLLLAVLAGLGLGLPYRWRPGGIRTHVLVTLGAAMFCATAMHLARAAGSQGEAMRILQGVATGVGFVGAASVLKRGDEIVGITTAASIWIAAAVGCGIVMGNLLITMLLTVIVVLLNEGLQYVEQHLFRHHEARLARGARPPVPPPTAPREA
jgi:putative Mg2+ transporter-C (MgtC) family protein